MNYGLIILVECVIAIVLVLVIIVLAMSISRHKEPPAIRRVEFRVPEKRREKPKKREKVEPKKRKEKPEVQVRLYDPYGMYAEVSPRELADIDRRAAAKNGQPGIRWGCRRNVQSLPAPNVQFVQYVPQYIPMQCVQYVPGQNVQNAQNEPRG